MEKEMIQKPLKNYNKFKYYLRQCDVCDEFFNAPAKKCRLCPICKKKSNLNKIMKSLKARGIKDINIKIKITELEDGHS